jgi:WD40 repeat protein
MKQISLLFIFQLIIISAYSRDKEGIITLKTDNKIINDICFSARGEVIGIADNNEIKVYGITSRELIREFKGGHRGQITTLNISSDSTLLATGGKDSTIVIWDFLTGTKLKSLHFQKGLVTSVVISPDGNYLASGGADDKVYLYDIKNDALIEEFNDHTDDVTCVTFSPDGKLLAASGGDKIITVYGTEDHKLLATLSGHTSWVRDLSFSHDAKRLLSCGDDARIIKWDISDTKMIRNISGKKYGHQWILSLDNSADDNTYAFADITGSIKILWLQGTYRGKTGVPVNRILLSPASGKRLQIAVATRGKGVMLIDGGALKLHVKQKYNYSPLKAE